MLDDREDAITSALAAIDSITVGNVNLPLSKMFLALRRWFGGHQDQISGSLFQYGKELAIVTELKNMRSDNVLHVWRVNGGKSDSAIPVMVEELAFRMLQDLCSGLDSKSWRSLQLFTQAIQRIERYGRDTRELSILEQAAEDLKEAIVSDPGYLRAHYTLGTVYSNLGRHDDARAEFLAVKQAGTQLRLEAMYNLGLAYYHKFQNWSYDYAESEFNSVIREIKQPKPTMSKQVLLAVSYCGLASVAAQRIGIAKRTGRDSEVQNLLGTVHDHCAQAKCLAGQSEDVEAAIYNSLGIAHIKAGNVDRGVTELMTAIGLKPGYPIAYVHLADTYMPERPDETIKWLELAITINPDSEYH